MTESSYDPPVDPNPGVPDHAAPAVKTEGLSPKALASSAVGLGVGILIAVLNAVQDNDLLGTLPPALQVILLAAIPPVLTFLAAYGASPGNVTVKRS
jgi:uncharacterized RDD family membrane protein YckC